MSNNPLGCDCNMFHSMDAVKATAIKGGKCNTPAQTLDYTFKGTMKDDPKYYLKVPRNHFQCCKYIDSCLYRITLK